jgi:hypothetical protein
MNANAAPGHRESHVLLRDTVLAARVHRHVIPGERRTPRVPGRAGGADLLEHLLDGVPHDA